MGIRIMGLGTLEWDWNNGSGGSGMGIRILGLGALEWGLE